MTAVVNIGMGDHALRLIAGFETPDAGTITIDGRQVASPESGGVAPHRRGVGYVAQDGALFPHLTVGQNIAYGLRGAARAEVRARVGELLETVSLDTSYASRRPHQLSGGQQQRVALARALARQPVLMLLDEPFSALDTGLRASTRKAVAGLLTDAGVTTLLVTHDQEEALSISDQVAVMRDGRFTQVGSPQQVYRHPTDRFTAEFLGDCISVSCTVASGVADCALGRIPVQASAADGPATLVLRPEQLVATVVSDSEQLDGVGTVIATEFLGHDVLLTIRPGRRRRTDRCAPAQPQPAADRRQGTCRGGGQRGRAQLSRLLDHLYRQGDNVAVLTDTQQLSYHHLADAVADTARALDGPRRLVVLETRNDVATLVHYLAAMAGGHVVLPVSAGRDHTAILKTYEPDVVIDADGIHHGGRRHRLHDELALLLSTSGSTGSPKLVRLSHRNLVSNAAAIAEYLDIRETDRAATTLPMSHCYGLSVIHSHLLRGAGLILTDRSVVDDEFWEGFRGHAGTAFAGVPYTFELLERVGAQALDVPHLRYVTQAGGRMPPERVRRFAELGRRQGWDLFVMYGATEATARMGYLPPQLAGSHPAAIGRPIPGGAFTIEPCDAWGDDVGELVYRGPNVMMGYAHGPTDLPLGKTVEALHTGDIVRRNPDGLYEVIGRSSRFVKMYGLRIDLQRVEATLRDRGVTAFCTDVDDHLAVAATGHDEEEVQRITAAAAGVPPAP
jgi:ABC-type Fe3+/spermidine/putrescine transport system ATPase subunit/acyl-CoA synthetase (AMP-forming)/AMP-acid ligase II